SRLLDEDPPHRLRRGGEEMASTLPTLSNVDVHESHVSLMDERGRLQRLAWTFLRHLRPGEPSKLLVHQREQALGGELISTFGLLEITRYIVHAREFKRVGYRIQPKGKAGSRPSLAR